MQHTNTSDKLKFIKTIPALSNFSQDFSSKLAEMMEYKEAQPDETIFSEGSASAHLYIIEEGEAIVIKKLSEETEKVLSVINDKNIFGEMSLFSAQSRTASVKAKTRLLYYRISIDAFKKLLSSDPAGTQKMLETLLFLTLGRLEQTSRELATIYEIGKMMIKSLPLPEFCQEIIKHLCLSVPDVNTGSLFFWNEFAGDYEPYGTFPENIQKTAIPGKHPLSTFLAGKTEAIAITNKEKEIKGIIDKEITNVKSAVISPLFKKNLLGFILLGNTAKEVTYQHTTCDLLNSVSLQLVDAIENIKNQEERLAKERLERNRTGSVKF